MRLARHWQRRQALRRQQCAARPLFTRPAWPRRRLRSHDHQRSSRKLSAHAVELFSPCAHQVFHYTAQAPRASAFVFLKCVLHSPRKRIALPGEKRADCTRHQCPCAVQTRLKDQFYLDTTKPIRALLRKRRRGSVGPSPPATQVAGTRRAVAHR
jgi:hypothetical protein